MDFVSTNNKKYFQYLIGTINIMFYLLTTIKDKINQLHVQDCLAHAILFGF